MLIREYRTDDLASIHGINEANDPAVASETIADLAHIAAESLIALVAEVDGVVAGFCLVLAPGADYDSVNYLWFAARYDDFVYLDRVAISAEHTRHGIGRAMYEEVERLAGERRPSASAFVLEVNIEPRNDDSLAFHDRLGFVEVGQQQTEYGTVVSLMHKRLSKSA